MKYLSLILILVFISCQNKKDILLPKSNSSIVKDIQDHSPIYIFFEAKGKDTIAEVNRKNSIISTNWILNIDKRLPLRLVIPEVMKLQQKSEKKKRIRTKLHIIITRTRILLVKTWLLFLLQKCIIKWKNQKLDL